MGKDTRIEACLRTAEKGKVATGRQEWVDHLSGKHLTLSQAVKARCYDCTCGYANGKEDCGVVTCALHQYMPYNKDRRKARVGRTFSEEEKIEIGKRLSQARRRSL